MTDNHLFMIFGAVIAIAGFILAINATSGEGQYTFKILGAEITLAAAGGIVVMLFGILTFATPSVIASLKVTPGSTFQTDTTPNSNNSATITTQAETIPEKADFEAIKNYAKNATIEYKLFNYPIGTSRETCLDLIAQQLVVQKIHIRSRTERAISVDRTYGKDIVWCADDQKKIVVVRMDVSGSPIGHSPLMLMDNDVFTDIIETAFP